ncbi:MAG: leucine-rich repeat protein [Clostridia bacterium]|nr:leucine-rich repeat protein [Clostridia bacterium]
MKKKWLGLLTAAFALTAAFGVAACGDKGSGEKTEIEQVYDQYVTYAKAEGQEPLSYEEWLETIKGATGEKGEKGDQGDKGDVGVGISSVTVNEDGALVITFTNGTSQRVDMPVSEQLRYQKIPGKEEYRVMGIGTVSDLDVVIPATYRGLPVTEIGEEAFEEINVSYITSVTIGENVTSIGEDAFAGCPNLTSVRMINR